MANFFHYLKIQLKIKELRTKLNFLQALNKNVILIYVQLRSILKVSELQKKLISIFSFNSITQELMMLNAWFLHDT